MGEPIVAVASCRERWPMWEFIDSRYELCRVSASYGIETHVLQKTTIYVGAGRTEISKAVISEDLPQRFTHVLFLDNDSCPHEESLKALLDWDVPIVSGLYFGRGVDADPVAYVASPGGKLCGRYRPIRPEVTQFLNEASIPPMYGPILVGEIGSARCPLMKVDVVGVGFLLVKREVLEVCSDWTMEDEGEDIAWCERARAAGFPIYLDLGVIVAHLGICPLSTAWFQYSCEQERRRVEMAKGALKDQENA